MSLYDYRASRSITDQHWPFYSLVMAAMRQADTGNHAVLKAAFPEVARELQARYDRPFGGMLRDECPAITTSVVDRDCGLCGEGIAGTELCASIPLGPHPSGDHIEICVACVRLHFDVPDDHGMTP